MSNPTSPEQAFEHGAGFSLASLSQTLALVSIALTLCWVLWTAWSGFKGMKRGQVGKEDYRRLLFKALFIFLLINAFSLYGVSTA
ncbi:MULTISPECIES: DUF3262 family protein [Vibrio]|uniref:Integrating conjugative element protein n=1 Tax=Vibrio splendidus TaxID=29497 RepID=A0A2N7JJD6_VIBSP|nr:DUF3262 family protein [Vibrio splendidus]PMM40573.1 integrating conjugative element protein [Vibrio splendidus]PMM64837.1 integrating conjugative element protein [Vibrio splendidus]